MSDNCTYRYNFPLYKMWQWTLAPLQAGAPLRAGPRLGCYPELLCVWELKPWYPMPWPPVLSHPSALPMVTLVSQYLLHRLRFCSLCGCSPALLHKHQTLASDSLSLLMLLFFAHCICPITTTLLYFLCTGNTKHGEKSSLSVPACARTNIFSQSLLDLCTVWPFIQLLSSWVPHPNFLFKT